VAVEETSTLHAPVLERSASATERGIMQHSAAMPTTTVEHTTEIAASASTSTMPSRLRGNGGGEQNPNAIATCVYLFI